ncbi:MAG: radical SAM protein [Planctomycetota bacterium]|nr:MAG: radical SAM protein [Planctomycetota bacterium]
MRNKAILLFPPNWSFCTPGPHLALPLLAGSVSSISCPVEAWDLNQLFYQTYSSPPKNDRIIEASSQNNYEALDELYFKWEDELKNVGSSLGNNSEFRLLSGYCFSDYYSLPPNEIVRALENGTVFSDMFDEIVLPQLVDVAPSIIGVTIASEQQIIPAIELLTKVRECLPGCILLLGGNVVTRIRNSLAFSTISGLVDQIVSFQGEMAFAKAVNAVNKFGVKKARSVLSNESGDELIPYENWPIPSFDGIDFNKYIGIPVIPYASTRGCYWGKCHFCAIPAGWSPNGYGGSAPAEFVVSQLTQIVRDTSIQRIKFVDEALMPSKADSLCKSLSKSHLDIEWEAYARLEPNWEKLSFLEELHSCGLRKLYFGLEQAPSANRNLLGKCDNGNPLRILKACYDAGIMVHLFCMVGYPGTSRKDAENTVEFLIEHEPLVDTADLVAFRLDRGTKVPGVTPVPNKASGWSMSVPYLPGRENVLSSEEVGELEAECQEALWETVPRFLHPLYRVIGHWNNHTIKPNKDETSRPGRICLPNLS